MVNRRPSAGNLFLGQPSTDRSAFRSFPSNEFSFVDLSIDTQQGQLAAKHRSSRFSSGVHDFLSRPRSLNTVGNVRIVSTDAYSSNLWIIDEPPCDVFHDGSTSEYDCEASRRRNTRSQDGIGGSWGSNRGSTRRLAKREDGSGGERCQEERREETRIEGNDGEAVEKEDRAPRREKERNRGVVVPADDEVALLLSLNTTRGS